ncbi:hypothetical protein JQK62_21610, partial [Leptospira santarosai]|nr:hypothetical protein [Leptospira santarosai]
MFTNHSSDKINIAHVELGLSSRASLALLHAAQGYAFINGRTFVTPDDV